MLCSSNNGAVCVCVGGGGGGGGGEGGEGGDPEGIAE